MQTVLKGIFILIMLLASCNAPINHQQSINAGGDAAAYKNAHVHSGISQVGNTVVIQIDTSLPNGRIQLQPASRYYYPIKPILPFPESEVRSIP